MGRDENDHDSETHHLRVKGWRPIVLANIVGKLAEKVVAQKLQEKPELWHERAFAGRKGRVQWTA